MPEGYQSTDRPEKLVEVHTGFEISDFPNIDDNSLLTVTVTLFIDLTWREPRLETNFTQEQIEQNKRVPLNLRNVDLIWKPDIFISNLVDYKEHKVLDPLAGLSIYPGNILEYWVTASVTIFCKMGFHVYPFDRQECPFFVQSSNYDNQRVSFTSYSTYDEESNRLQEFDLILTDISHDDKEVENDGYVYSQVGFVVYMNRYTGPFILKYYIPCFTMVLICFVSFVIPADSIPGRASLLVTLFLVLSTFFGDIQATTPQSEGLTALQVYVLTCLMFAFAATMEYAFILTVLKRHNHRVHLTNRRRQLEARKNASVSSSTLSNSGEEATIFTTRTEPTKRQRGRLVEDRGTFSLLNLHGDIDDPEIFAYVIDRRAAIVFFVFFILFNVVYVIYFTVT